MRHRRRGRILKREKAGRKALLRALMRGIVFSKSIVTTEARAKEVRPHLERLITKERRGTLAAHREVVTMLGKDAAIRMKKNIVPALGERTSGYLRITKIGQRSSDASRMVHISLVE